MTVRCNVSNAVINTIDLDIAAKKINDRPDVNQK